MARTDNRRNVVIIITQDGATWRGRGVEIQDDGTLALGTAVTSTVSRQAVVEQLVQSSGATGSTPENSALYSQADVLEVVYAPVHVIDALP